MEDITAADIMVVGTIASVITAAGITVVCTHQTTGVITTGTTEATTGSMGTTVWLATAGSAMEWAAAWADAIIIIVTTFP